MMGRSLLVILLAVAPALAQAPATADSTVPLFVVMAAVNAAGYDAGLDSQQNSPIRKQVRDEIAASKPASLDALRVFYNAHKNPDPARDLSQYISFSLLIKGPPDFEFRVRDDELPREVDNLRDLRPLLGEFYKEAHLDTLWEKYHTAYEMELARYNDTLAQVSFEVNGYFRIASSGFLGRDFSIYVDLLGAPSQANARSFGTDYYVVLSAAVKPQSDEVRHGYLHYILDPMASKYPSLLQSKQQLRAVAETAPALDPALKRNFRLLLGECLIRAAEVRLSPVPLAAKQQRVQDLLADGYILAPYFFEALEKFEKQDAGMRIYYPDLLEGLDVGHEERRLSKAAFHEAAPSAVARTEETLAPTAPAPGVALRAGGTKAGSSETASGGLTSEEEKLLATGEDALARKDFAQARQAFQTAAELKGPLLARAIYGLALVASQERNPQLAKTYFQQALDATHDPHVVAWANIYLGRIFDMEDNREQAVKHYQQALAAGNIEPGTRQAAERGLQAPFKGAAPRQNP